MAWIRKKSNGLAGNMIKNSFFYSHFGRLGGATSTLVPAQMMTGGEEHMAIRALHGATAKRGRELVELVEEKRGISTHVWLRRFLTQRPRRMCFSRNRL